MRETLADVLYSLLYVSVSGIFLQAAFEIQRSQCLASQFSTMFLQEHFVKFAQRRGSVDPAPRSAHRHIRITIPYPIRTMFLQEHFV